MRITNAVPLLLALVASCGDYAHNPVVPPPPPPPPPPAVQLKDITFSNLPSPYYHFEYGADGRVTRAAYASDLRTYDLKYTDGRLVEMDNQRNPDSLQYVYGTDGKVALVKYVTPSGVVRLVELMYDGGRLKKLERSVRVTGGFIIEKTIDFTYDADGNVHQRVVHFPPIDGVQTEATTVDTYENYDTGINVDGFDLIHDEFFDHLVLLPGVQFQKNNPLREIRTGDGINYVVEYFRTYDGLNRPRVRIGTLTFTNGNQVGQSIPTLAQYSYY